MKLRNALGRYLSHTGITASTLAEKAGVPKATLLGWCAGRKPRNLEQVEMVANYIGVSLESLLLDKLELKPMIITASNFSGFSVDREGWHTGTLEVRFRHVSRGSK